MSETVQNSESNSAGVAGASAVKLPVPPVPDPLAATKTGLPLVMETLTPKAPLPDEYLRQVPPPAPVPPVPPPAPPGPTVPAPRHPKRSHAPAVLNYPPPSLSLLEQKAEELLAMQGTHPDSDLITDIIMTAVRMMRDGSDRGDLRIIASAVRELRYAFEVFRPYRQRRKVTAFGSARTQPDAPEYKAAWSFSEEMVKRNYMIITGAGGGIMEAAQGGAGREHSFGVNIKLPFEQHSNKYIDGDKKLISFRYFFTRKLCFLKEASAVAVFPGGFGTHDECFEAMTLIQTGKAGIVPLIFIDKPGGHYWRDWADYVVQHLLANKLISADDMHLINITDDPVWAANTIERFYNRYHSMRYVMRDTGELTVLRLNTPLTAQQLDQINGEFSNSMMLVEGKITQGVALTEETETEPELNTLPRLVMRFNRRNYGRMRLLIDAINRDT